MQVGSKAFANTRGLGRSVDRHKNEIRFLDGRVNVGGEEKVSTTALAHDFVQTGFKHGKRFRVPRCDSNRVHIDNDDLDVRALERDYRARRTTNVPCTDTADCTNMCGDSLKVFRRDAYTRVCGSISPHAHFAAICWSRAREVWEGDNLEEEEGGKRVLVREDKDPFLSCPRDAAWVRVHTCTNDERFRNLHTEGDKLAEENNTFPPN